MAAKTWDEVYGEGAQQPTSTFPCKACGWTGPVENMPDISGMPHADLVGLVQRMFAQCGMVVAMTEEQTAQAMLDTLAHTALKPIVAGINMRADIQSRMSAIDKWLDRTRGKAVQTLQVDQRITHNTQAGHMTMAQIDAELAKLGRLPAGGMLQIEGECVMVPDAK